MHLHLSQKEVSKLVDGGGFCKRMMLHEHMVSMPMIAGKSYSGIEFASKVPIVDTNSIVFVVLLKDKSSLVKVSGSISSANIAITGGIFIARLPQPFSIQKKTVWRWKRIVYAENSSNVDTLRIERLGIVCNR